MAKIDIQKALKAGKSEEEIRQAIQVYGLEPINAPPEFETVFFPGTNLPLMERGGPLFNILKDISKAAPAVGSTLGYVGGGMAAAPPNIISELTGQKLKGPWKGPTRIFGATAGQAGGQVISQSLEDLLGISPGPQEQLKELTESTAETFAGTTALEGVLFGGGKLLQPIKSLLKARNAAALKHTGKISGDTLVKAGQEASRQAPEPIRKSVQKFAAEGVKRHSGRSYSVSEALKMKSFYNQAFTKAGNLKSGAANFYDKFLGDAIRSQIGQVAPNVARYDVVLSKVAYPASKFLKRLLWPALIGGAVYGGIRKGGEVLGE